MVDSDSDCFFIIIIIFLPEERLKIKEKRKKPVIPGTA